MADNDAIGDFKMLLDAPGLAELGPGPRTGVLPVAKLEESMRQLLNAHKLRPDSRELARALLLLWHDHSDAAHVIAQEAENADGSFVHGIVHRREPDYSNAAYWFRRVGAHPAFSKIAACAGELLAVKNAGELKSKLLPGGKWDAFGFIHACEKASASPVSSQVQLLREIQHIETEELLAHLLAV